MPNVTLMSMSVANDQGVAEVKEHVCTTLRDIRIDAKKSSRKFEKIQSQLHIAKPDHEWEPCIPQSVMNHVQYDGPLLRDLERSVGGAGQFVADYNQEKDLNNPDWRNDIIPEIIDGRNVSDYLDPNIMENFQKLIEEEKQRVVEYEAEKNAFEESKWRITPEQVRLGNKIKNERVIRRKKSAHNPMSPKILPQKFKPLSAASAIKSVSSYLDARGVDETSKQIAIEKIASQPLSRPERHFEPLPRNTGIHKRADPNINSVGVRFDHYVKKNYVLEPKFLFSGKSGFKRDFK